MSNTYHNNDSGGESYHDQPNPPDGGLDLLTDPIDAFGGERPALEREAPNGRLIDADAPSTEFGVDRNQNGSFASRDTEPTTLVRHDDGTLGSDPLAVGNFGEFDEEFRYSSTGGDR